MKEENKTKNAAMARRIIQYFIGLVFMALAVVCTKRSDLGLSPFSTAPAAINNITGFQLGTTTTIVHIVCVIVMIIVQRKITLKTILTFFVAFPFGWIIDLLMLVIGPVEGLVLRFVVNIIGILCTALGVTLIVGADLMLPAPDAMLRTISLVFKKSYPKVKITGDCFWMILAFTLEAVFAHEFFVSVNIGTVLAALFVGSMVKVFSKWMPFTNLVKEAKL